VRTLFGHRVKVAATVEDVANHIDHAVKVAGIDHVGIGSDFDGVSGPPNGSVIFVTAKADNEARARALQQGAAAFFTKPFHDDALLGAIQSAMQNRLT
jgi:microsomal dipeptidase-like Zn-dependent dipeptidase